jgi:DNA-binding XRE family transcriptional regulator
MPSVLNELSVYLKLNRISQSAFAETLDTYQTTISRLCRGAQVPSLSLAVAIEDETDGAVSHRYWLQFLDQQEK